MRLLTILAAVLWLGFAATPAARGNVLTQSDFFRPLADIAAKPLGPDEGVVVIGYAVRNVRTGASGTWPVHMGWMPFADDSLMRTGSRMVAASERCAYGSEACRNIQYRVYRLPAGGYSLAWIFQDKLYGVAKFEKGQVRFSQSTREIDRAEFSDDAQSSQGAPALRVIAGQVNYVGNLLVQFRGEQAPRIAWTERSEAEVAAMMKAAGYETMLNFQGSRIGRR